jgi:hypothetical protein
MNLNVTQENLYLFLPGKTSRMAQIYASRHDISIVDALTRVYNSATYHELEIEETKQWHNGPVELYREMMTEE